MRGLKWGFYGVANVRRCYAVSICDDGVFFKEVLGFINEDGHRTVRCCGFGKGWCFTSADLGLRKRTWALSRGRGGGVRVS